MARFFSLLQTLVQLARLVGLDVIALAQGAFTGVDDGEEVEHLAVLDAAVGRLDEAIFVDARKAASDEMRPMLGPSGVSIGQMRP